MPISTEHMTTKRSKLRKGAAGTGKTVAKSSNTRKKRKAVTAKKMALAVVVAVAKKKAAAPEPAKVKVVKKAAVKAVKK